MYQINQLSFSYETKEVLKNISVTFPTNKITAIIGPNGCGKSTLLSHLYRLHPTKNKITLNEKPLESYKGREFAQLVAVLTQSRDAMIDDFLVKDIVLMGRYPYKQHFGTYSSEDVKIAEHYMNEVGITHLSNEEIHHLSGGEKQRVFIAKALTQKPQILLLDEPTNHLDVPTREIVERALQQFGGTCFIISHDRYFLDQVSTRTLVLENKGLTEYLGNYSYYKEKLKEQQDIAALTEVVEEVAKEDVKCEAKTISTSPSDEPKKKTNTYMVEKQLAEVEEEIARLEATMKMYEVQLANPVVQQDLAEMENISKQLSDTESNLQKLYEKWEHFSELLVE